MNYHPIKTKVIIIISVFLFGIVFTGQSFCGVGDPLYCNCDQSKVNCPCDDDPQTAGKCETRANKGPCGHYGCFCAIGFGCGPNQQGQYSCNRETLPCQNTSGDHQGCACSNLCISFTAPLGGPYLCHESNSVIDSNKCICDPLNTNGCNYGSQNQYSHCNKHCSTAEIQTDQWKKSDLKPCGAQPLCQPVGVVCPACCGASPTQKGACNYCSRGAKNRCAGENAARKCFLDLYHCGTNCGTIHGTCNWCSWGGNRPFACSKAECACLGYEGACKTAPHNSTCQSYCGTKGVYKPCGGATQTVCPNGCQRNQCSGDYCTNAIVCRNEPNAPACGGGAGSCKGTGTCAITDEHQNAGNCCANACPDICTEPTTGDCFCDTYPLQCSCRWYCGEGRKVNTNRCSPLSQMPPEECYMGIPY